MRASRRSRYSMAQVGTGFLRKPSSKFLSGGASHRTIAGRAPRQIDAGSVRRPALSRAMPRCPAMPRRRLSGIDARLCFLCIVHCRLCRAGSLHGFLDIIAAGRKKAMIDPEPRVTKPPLDILLCAPRGFCAGVVRAIDAVEKALQPAWRAGLCPPRDRAQQIRGRIAEAEGRGLRRRAVGGARCDAPGDLLGPWRAEIGAGRGAGARALRHRRDLPAGDQGASRGRGPSQARPPHPARRPCRPSRGHRHDGAVAAGRDHADRDAGRCRDAGAAGRRRRSPMSPRRRCRSTIRAASSRRCRRAFPI